MPPSSPDPTAHVERAPDYPLTLRVTGRTCVVVGGGAVAARRASALLEAGASVQVIAPHVCEEIRLAAQDPRVALTWQERPYRTGDLDDAWLAHTATGSADVDAQVSSDAEQQRIWCVQASDVGTTAAWVPAVSRVDDVVVAVNAGGDPRRAMRLRDAIAAALRAGLLPLRRIRGRSPAGADSPGERPSTPGWVALIGGGPGALDLLTVRARTLLAEADVVVIDRLAPRDILAELTTDVVVIDVGKSSGDHPVPQEEINDLLVRHARAGSNVVRLKGGDPYVFGRGGEELDVCRAAGLHVEVVPGVTSAISVPAAVGIPVTQRGLSRGFSVLTAHEDIGHVPAVADHTLVLLMGLRRLDQTCSELVDRGHDPHTPVAVIEDGFGPRQRATTGTLATIAQRVQDAGVKAPAITVIGDVVRRSPAWEH